jgi:hypothetical protein
MTYQKLLDYLTKITENKPPVPVKKGNGDDNKGWDCRHCLPCNEYYHCLYYIKRKINEKFLGVKKRQNPITASYPFQMGDVFVDVYGSVFRNDKPGEPIKIGRISNYDCKSYTEPVCNACRFVPEYPTHCKKPPSDNCCNSEIYNNEMCDKKICFWYFMNQCRTYKDINDVIPGVNSSLAYWICSAFDFDVNNELKKIGLADKQFTSLSWKIDGKDIREMFFDEKFWKERLCDKLAVSPDCKITVSPNS